MTMTAAEVVTAALHIKDSLEKDKAEFEAKTTPKKEALRKAELWLLKYLNDQGLQNINVKGLGTAFKRKVTSVSCADWAVAWDWMRNTERYDMLNHSVNKTVVQAYVEEMGSPPPGINYTADIEISINRARPTAKEET